MCVCICMFVSVCVCVCVLKFSQLLAYLKGWMGTREDVPKFVAYYLNNLPPLTLKSIDISTLLKNMKKIIKM